MLPKFLLAPLLKMFICKEGDLYQKACHLQGDIKAAQSTSANDSLVFSVIRSIERVEPSDKGHKGANPFSHVRVSNYLLNISLRTDAEDTKWE